MRTAIKVMSFNISCGELYEDRLDRIVKQIQVEDPDIVGLQEGVDVTCNKILNDLGNEYEMLGHGRDENKDGENNNVLYKKRKFELLESKTLWLSDTPEEWSKHPESNCHRIQTYQLLKRKEDGTVFLHVNTHFDHISSDARVFQAKILTNSLSEAFGNNYPILITGDFNCTKESEEYRTIINAGYSVTNIAGINTNTYNGYGEETPLLIDFCFINNSFETASYKVCEGKIDGEWVSDHNAIVSEILISPKEN